MECERKQINDLVRKIRAGKPPQLPAGKREEFWILDGALGSFGSFGIREWMSGTALGTAWALQSKRHGKQRKKHIGSVHVLDTDQALNAAKDLAAKMQLELLDPVAAKKNAMKTAKVTFESQVEAFLKSNGLRRSTLVSWTRQLTGPYLRPLHKLPLDEITAPQIGTLIDKIEFGSDGSKPRPAVAWQVYWVLNRFFGWAYETGKVARDFVNPMGQVREPAKGNDRERNLDDAEVRLIWKACEEWEADVLAEEAQVAAGGNRIKAGRASSTDCPRAVRVLFLTGCRPQEIGDLKWSQVDLEAGELNIPQEIYKTGKYTKGDVVIPLSDTALEILRSVKRKPGREYVFGQVGNKGRSDTGAGAGLDLTHARDVIDWRIANAGAPEIDPAVELRVRELIANGVPTYRIRGEAHVGWHTIKEIQARIDAGLPVAEPAKGKTLSHWQLRDIRRTFSTKLHSINIPHDVVERLLGHLVGKKMGRVYNKYDFWPEKRQAIAQWDAHLRTIIDGTAKKIERPKFGLRSA